MTAPRIDKGVPIPTKHAETDAALRQLAEAETGDSMLFPASVSRGAINAAMRRIGKGWATTRTDGAGVRVWKTGEPR